MPRRSKQGNPEKILSEVRSLLTNFQEILNSKNLRKKVLALVPSFHKLHDLGCSLIPAADANSAIDRILYYLKKYPQTIIAGDELMVVGGISEWARRVRQLRVEFGWQIVNGRTAREMAQEGDFPLIGLDVSRCGSDHYILTDTKQDREAAYRWKVANKIRREKGLSVQAKILRFLRENVGRIVTGEELRYVANNKTEWARRARELRTEEGFPVLTKQTGRPDLPIGSYLLEEDRQTPPHDRKILDEIRLDVLRRDSYTCQDCTWSRNEWDPSDPRHLELHHIKHHAKGGENFPDNLVTLCTRCHDKRHKNEKSRPMT
jgi:hypothetical protein